VLYLYVRILRRLSPYTRISRTLSPYVRIPRPVHCPPQIEHVVRGIPHQRREFVNGEWTSQGDINGDPGHPSSVQEARGRTSQGNIKWRSGASFVGAGSSWTHISRGSKGRSGVSFVRAGIPWTDISRGHKWRHGAPFFSAGSSWTDISRGHKWRSGAPLVSAGSSWTDSVRGIRA